MKKLLSIVVLVACVTAAQADPASSEQSLAAQRAACFLKHGKQMDKPAIRTERDCWRVHGYLMERG